MTSRPCLVTGESVCGREAGNPPPCCRYLSVGEQFVTFLHERDADGGDSEINREHVEHYLAAMFERGTSRPRWRSTTARFSSFSGSSWTTERSPLTDGADEPAGVPEQPVPVLTDDELIALLGTCKGRRWRTGVTRRSSGCLWIRAFELQNSSGSSLDDLDLASRSQT